LVSQEDGSIKSSERNKMTNTVMTTETMQLFNADYKEILQQGVQGDLLIIDPPYNINIDDADWDSDFDYEELFGVLKSILAKKGSVLLFNSPQNLILLTKLIEQFDFELQDLILWQKPNVIPRYIRTRGYTTKAREYIFYFTHKGVSPYFKLAPFESYHDGVYKYPRVTSNDRRHICQKPLPLIDDLILRHSQLDDLVIDLFLGSGVSALSAQKLRRRFIGYEQDENTFQKILRVLK
jgi:site-specific DNA-methyltransferase (adenine-specific)